MDRFSCTPGANHGVQAKIGRNQTRVIKELFMYLYIMNYDKETILLSVGEIQCPFCVWVKQGDNPFVFVENWRWSCHQSRWGWRRRGVADPVDILGSNSELVALTQFKVPHFADWFGNVVVEQGPLFVREFSDLDDICDFGVPSRGPFGGDPRQCQIMSGDFLYEGTTVRWSGYRLVSLLLETILLCQVRGNVFGSVEFDLVQ